MSKVSPAAVTPHRLRIFTLRFAMFVLIFGAILLHRHFSYYPVWAGAWVGYLVICLLFPIVITPVRWPLLKLSRAAEIVSTFLALCALYFLIITPLGLLARLFGKRFLQLKREPERASYWIPRKATESDPAQWERQF